MAARLEGVAEAGGICISRSAFDQVKDKLSIGFEDIGPQQVKNIPEPVPAFAVVLAADGVAWWQPFAPDVEPASIDKMAFKLDPLGHSAGVEAVTSQHGLRHQGQMHHRQAAPYHPLGARTSS